MSESRPSNKLTGSDLLALLSTFESEDYEQIAIQAGYVVQTTKGVYPDMGAFFRAFHQATIPASNHPNNICISSVESDDSTGEIVVNNRGALRLNPTLLQPAGIEVGDRVKAILDQENNEILLKKMPPLEDLPESKSSGRQPGYTISVQTNGTALIGASYIKQLDVQPGDLFRIDLHPDSGEIVLNRIKEE